MRKEDLYAHVLYLLEELAEDMRKQTAKVKDDALSLFLITR